MNEYAKFSQVYDVFMNEELYEKWAVYLKRLFSQYGISPRTVLDLGCGTGRLAKIMHREGYDVIGVDLSEDMLSIARGGSVSGECPMYLHQDITKLDLYGTVGAVYSTFDTINHLTGKEDLEKCFERVSLFTEPEGIFVFDVNTLYKYKNVLDGQAYTFDNKNYYCVWQSEYDDSESLCQFDITFFKYNNNGLYKKYHEIIFERYYPQDYIVRELQKNGFEEMKILDGDTFKKAHKTSQRLIFAARKKK